MTVPDISAGVELVDHGLHRVDGAHFVAMHAAHQNHALAGLRAPDDDNRHIPVLPARHLDALEIQKMLLPGLQVLDMKRADDLLSLDDLAGVDGAVRRFGRGAVARCCRLLGARAVRAQGRRPHGRQRSHQEVAPIGAFFGLGGHGGPSS